MLKNENFNNKIDIWDFGCIIYELLTLNYAYNDINIKGLSDKILNGMYDKINTNKYMKTWQKLVDWMLKPNFNDRPNINQICDFLLDEFKEKKETKIEKEE